MKYMISKKLKAIYKEQHKNYDYAISSIMDNFDPDSYLACFEIIKSFELEGEKCEICIGDKLVERISADLNMDTLNDMTVEILLWIGVMFPEV